MAVKSFHMFLSYIIIMLILENFTITAAKGVYKKWAANPCLTLYSAMTSCSL